MQVLALALAAYLGVLVVVAVVLFFLGHSSASVGWGKEYDKLYKIAQNEILKAYTGKGNIDSANSKLKTLEKKSNLKLVKSKEDK